MNLSPPDYRNSFHPAWFLLLLVPVMGVAGLVVNLPGNSPQSVVWRSILAAVFLTPLVWWRVAAAPPGVRRWMKELRQQLPGCLMAFVLPGVMVVAGLSYEPMFGTLLSWVQNVCLIGCLVVASATFGAEFEQRTMAGFLTQPIPRSSLYRQKLGTLAVLIAFAVLNLELILLPIMGNPRGNSPSLDPNVGIMTGLDFGLMALAIFCTTPFFTLVTRSTLAGAIFTIAVPLLLMAMGLLIDTIGSRVLGYPSAYVLPAWFREARIHLGIYFLACAWLGWRQFALLQVRDAGGGQGGLHALSMPTDRWLAAIVPTGGIGQLVRKELRLHVVPWLVSGIMVGLWALLMVIRRVATDDDTVRILTDPQGPMILAGMMAVLIILVSGSACVAEERQLGTLDWQLTQPLTLARQWRVKVVVALGLALTCGVILPTVLLRVMFGPELFPITADSGWKLAIAAYAALVLLIHTVAVYASSFSRSTMKATAAAIGIAAGVGAVLVPVVVFVGFRTDSMMAAMNGRAEESRLEMPAWVPDQEVIHGLMIGGVAVLVVAFLVLLRHFGFRNFRGAGVSRATVVRQLGVLTLAVVLPSVVLAEGFGRLMMLNHEANVVRFQAEQLRNDAKTLKRILGGMVSTGTVDPDILTQFGLGPEATAHEITDVILSRSSPGEVHQWLISLITRMSERSPANPSADGGPGMRMDPQMMRR